jgi:hypothetical protein
MVDGQQIDLATSRWESACNQAAAAKSTLFELLEQYPSVDLTDPIWHSRPQSGECYQSVGMEPAQAAEFEAMNDAERVAWFEKRVARLDAERQQTLAGMPLELRTAVVRCAELSELEYRRARALAKKMYQRGLLGIIADKLRLQEVTELEQYLNIEPNPPSRGRPG